MSFRTPDHVERELRRVVERIVSLGPARLARPSEHLDGDTPEQRVRRVAQWLADRAAALERRPRVVVPDVAPHALGDQIAVLARDVLMAAPDDWDVADELHQHLVALRRSL
ncbi:MAG TPA: hypothetical protein VFX33_04650 [Actinomycetales bacterium]|nr:hypothetical protein [Actinomycetales bacterium]